MIDLTGADIVDIVTTLSGTAAILVRMRRYVTVDEYRSKVASLHKQINRLEVKVARMESRK